jgi:anti-anti-sigma factor
MTTTEIPRSSPTVLAATVELSHYERGQTVVWIEGEHDIATVDELTETLAKAVSADDNDLILDLDGVTFLSVTTVDVLVRLRELLAEQSRSLTIRSPSRPARRVLRLYEAASSSRTPTRCRR